MNIIFNQITMTQEEIYMYGFFSGAIIIGIYWRLWYKWRNK